MSIAIFMTAFNLQSSKYQEIKSDQNNPQALNLLKLKKNDSIGQLIS